MSDFEEYDTFDVPEDDAFDYLGSEIMQRRDAKDVIPEKKKDPILEKYLNEVRTKKITHTSVAWLCEYLLRGKIAVQPYGKNQETPYFYDEKNCLWEEISEKRLAIKLQMAVEPLIENEIISLTQRRKNTSDEKIRKSIEDQLNREYQLQGFIRNVSFMKNVAAKVTTFDHVIDHNIQEKFKNHPGALAATDANGKKIVIEFVKDKDTGKYRRNIRPRTKEDYFLFEIPTIYNPDAKPDDKFDPFRIARAMFLEDSDEVKDPKGSR